MHASTIQNLAGLCFQMETTLLLKTQHFGQYEPPEFEALTMQEKKAQAAMIMAKINRLLNFQRAMLWALHVQRETEMIYPPHALQVRLQNRPGHHPQMGHRQRPQLPRPGRPPRRPPHHPASLRQEER